MNVLVTGGAGFIGSHLVDALIEKGHKVTVFDNLDPQVHGTALFEDDLAHYNPQARYVIDDMAFFHDVHLRDIDVVFHLAAAVGVGQSQYQPVYYVDANTLSTANLWQAIIDSDTKPKKVIVAGSMSCYGEGPTFWDQASRTYLPGGTREDRPLDCRNIYAMTKRHQEEMSLLLGKIHNVPTTVLRFFNCYGPRQSLSNPYTGVVAIFLSRLMNDKPPVVYEDGLQTRDFVHVKDVVQACLLAMEKDEANGNVFNVGTGVPTSIRTLALNLAKITKKDIEPTITGEYRKGDIRHCYADIDKARELLGYKPKIALATGLLDLYAWSLFSGEIPEDKFDEAHAELKEMGGVK